MSTPATLETVMNGLIKRRAEMALTTFEHPPADWPGFTQRLGAFIECSQQIEELRAAIRGQEHDEE